jgi:hypothetical protein
MLNPLQHKVHLKILKDLFPICKKTYHTDITHIVHLMLGK